MFKPGDYVEWNGRVYVVTDEECKFHDNPGLHLRRLDSTIPTECATGCKPVSPLVGLAHELIPDLGKE